LKCTTLIGETSAGRHKQDIDQRRRACRAAAFKSKKRMKILRMTRLKSFTCVRENYALNSLGNFEPMRRSKNRRNVVKFRLSGYSTNIGI
jgi:hypothetical protein